MAWFKVDDTLAFHHKVLAAGNTAMGLWVRAGAWSMQQLTDGFIPEHVELQMARRQDAQRLINAGLWIPKDDGYVFHQWQPRQPSRAKVEADREAAAERQRRARAAARRSREQHQDDP